MAMTAAVKDELSRTDVSKPCCRRSEMAALLRFAGGLHIAAEMRNPAAPRPPDLGDAVTAVPAGDLDSAC